jgi:hypothetical protein
MSGEKSDRPAGAGAPRAGRPLTAPLSAAKLAIGTVALSLATFMNVRSRISP